MKPQDHASHSDASRFALQASSARDERALGRLRWRCRRGLLENDLILARFLDAEGERLTEADRQMLMRLLDLPDNELWDLLSGKIEPADQSIMPLLQRLRAI